jgi:hypothetical protein
MKKVACQYFYFISVAYVIICQLMGKYVPPISKESKVVIFFYQVEEYYIVALANKGPLI